MQILPSKTVSSASTDTGSPLPFSATHSYDPDSLFFLTGSIRNRDPPSKSDIRYLQHYVVLEFETQ